MSHRISTNTAHVRIFALSRGLSAVWHASTMTQAERKNLLRMVITDVTLSPIDAPTRMKRAGAVGNGGRE
jgi:hypothetical protein